MEWSDHYVLDGVCDVYFSTNHLPNYVHQIEMTFGVEPLLDTDYPVVC